MTLPPVVRVFFALELPQQVKDHMSQVMSDIKKRTKNHAIRWTKPENMHVTLQFIGEVQLDDVSKLVQHVRGSLAGRVKPLSLRMGKLCLFPSPFRPRVLVVDIAGQAELAALAGLIGEGITAASYAVEKRPFRGHLTLGRIKQPHGLDLSFLPSIVLPEWEAIAIAEIVLFRSEPHPEGSHYTPLERLALR